MAQIEEKRRGLEAQRGRRTRQRHDERQAPPLAEASAISTARSESATTRSAGSSIPASRHPAPPRSAAAATASMRRPADPQRQVPPSTAPACAINITATSEQADAAEVQRAARRWGQKKREENDEAGRPPREARTKVAEAAAGALGRRRADARPGRRQRHER